MNRVMFHNNGVKRDFQPYYACDDATHATQVARSKTRLAREIERSNFNLSGPHNCNKTSRREWLMLMSYLRYIDDFE